MTVTFDAVEPECRAGLIGTVEPVDALAQLEVWHSRPHAPTRRVALGTGTRLPVEKVPGFGGFLLAGVVAAFVTEIDDDLIEDSEGLMADLLADRRISQPRLRHRLQVDRIGLTLSTHRLRAVGQSLAFDFADDAPPAPQVVAAIYEAGRLPLDARRPVMELIRRGLSWSGGRDERLVSYLTGMKGVVGSGVAVGDPHAWAQGVLGLEAAATGRKEINKRFRELARAAHPDHGGVEVDAAARLDELTRARRILLGS